MNDILYFLYEYFTKKKLSFLHFYISYIHQMVYVRRLGGSMVRRFKDNNPLGTQKIVSLDFDKEWARVGHQGKLRNFTTDHSRRCYMAEI